MGNVFAITAASDEVTLEDGQGKVVFNVHNRTERGIGAWAKIEGLGDTKTEWLGLEGNVERQFNASESHQFTVTMKVPAGAKPGKYSFRLRVASKAKPDDEFEDGPAVAVTIKESGTTKKTPWGLIIGIAATVLGVAGVLIWFISAGEPVVVPDVVGKQAEVASLAITEGGLSVVAIAVPLRPGVSAGQVVEQKPTGGSEADAGSTVELTVAIPSDVTVPDVQYKPLAVAQQILSEVGLGGDQKDSVPEGDGVAAGGVSRQNPAAGQQVPQGSIVELTVAVALVVVPEVVGKRAEIAKQEFAGLGLSVVEKATPLRPGLAAGQVAAQNPRGGSKVDARQPVELTVAAASIVTVPDVQFKPLRVAIQSLREVGIDGRQKDTVPEGRGFAAGVVSKQDPAAGQQVPQGSSVALTVAEPLVIVPNLKGQSIAEASRLLRGANLEVKVVTIKAKAKVTGPFSIVLPKMGIVHQQQPAAKKRVPSGSIVRVTVFGR